MKVASFFSGIGGLDLGFINAGFEVVYANENHPETSRVFRENHPQTHVDTRSLVDVLPEDVREVEGFIGGPPCQSWSVAGARRGDVDPRGRLIWDYASLIARKRPKFFVLENVPGLMSRMHRQSLIKLLGRLSGGGYNVGYGVLNAGDYGVPQSRVRVFIVGYRSDSAMFFTRPPESEASISIGEALDGLGFADASGLRHGDRGFEDTEPFQGNHYLLSDHFSYIYMSRNRVRPPDSFAFTVQASPDHAQLHPSAPPMEPVKKDVFRFQPGSEHLYRRISVRESARIQTFPDSYAIRYRSIRDGYRMVGNAVPVKLAEAVASQIMNDVRGTGTPLSSKHVMRGSMDRFDSRQTAFPLFSA